MEGGRGEKRHFGVVKPGVPVNVATLRRPSRVIFKTGPRRGRLSLAQ